MTQAASTPRRISKAGRPPSPEGRVSLNITVPPKIAEWLKAQGGASAMVKSLVEAHLAGARSCEAADAARYRAIREHRVGGAGACEIWNVAYVGRALDEAVDALIAADATLTTRRRAK